MSKTNKLTLLPVMLCFFAMGFVDLVGIASNYVKNDLQLSDSTANVFPSLVFFWFLIFSVPTGMLMAPYLAIWGAQASIPAFGLGWRVLFPIYLIVGTIATLLLFSTPIEEEPIEGKASSFTECFRLLGKPIVLLSFLGIMCHVGIDVGTNTTAPKILMERLGMSLNDAAFATSLYFIFRTIGCLTGSFFLRVMNNKLFFIISVTMMALSMCGMAVGTSKTVLFVAIALVGYGNSNVFSMVFARALQSVPEKQNEVSGLMIMGLFGGTIFPLLMGFASDGFGQVGAVVVMAVGVLYLFSYIPNMNNK